MLKQVQVLETFSHQDRASFLRFVWGRSRLPRPSDFAEAFKIHLLPPGDQRSVPFCNICLFILALYHPSCHPGLRA